ncbi:leucine-rich repeat transmembrane protein kinase protein, partial [Tanacetum coccineum]
MVTDTLSMCGDGFISIDCGIGEGSTYIDNITGINYVSDVDFVDSGESHNIMPINNLYADFTQLTTLRSFLENTRNCYTLKPTKGKGHGTPIISAIELRLLGNNIYLETSFGALYLFSRKTFQNRYKSVRFRGDKYDRLWNMFLYHNVTVISTNDSVYPAPNETNFAPSPAVMSSAITPMYPFNSIHLRWEPKAVTDQYFIYAYFAEIQLLEDNQIREFNIYLNGYHTYGPFSLEYHTTNVLYYGHPLEASPTYKLEINKTENSTLLPIINALELYTLKQLPKRQTDDQGAGVMWSIKSTYKIAKHWQGDPCSPHEDDWDGIGCSYNDAESHRIALLNLSASGLNKEIYPGLANLIKIHTLDLSNNNLTGTVPKFLVELTCLRVLTCTSMKPSISHAGSVTELIHACKTKAGSELEIRKQNYIYLEVQSIKDNFSVVIGKGGSGRVYQGNIGDTQVAVKMLFKLSEQGNKEFQSE